MTFAQFFSAVIKRWMLVIACFIAIGLGTYIGSKLITPLYQSTAIVQIAYSGDNNQSDYTNLLASEQLVQTEASLATSDPVLREVASHYPGLSVNELAKKVSATTKLNTQLFQVDVLDANPQRAADLANDIVRTLIKQQSQIVQQRNARKQQQIQGTINQLGQQINAITAKIAALRAQGGDPGQIALLQAQLNGLQQNYGQWQSALVQLELSQAQNGDLLQVVQAAKPASTHSQPNILLNTAGGLLVGLMAGILLAALLELLDTRVRTPEAISQLLGRPILATIWLASSSKKKKDAAFHPAEDSANAEAFRILRTNIGFLAVEHPLRSIVVTSALPFEGKSTIAANLAIFMAKTGKTTLLIDADLRDPMLYQFFGLSPDEMGLSDAIQAFSRQTTTHELPTLSWESSSASSAVQRKLDPFIHKVDIPNLYVMPSGPLPPNPPELLDSKAMQLLFTALANHNAEVIIFDTCPLLGLSDARIVASKVDGTLIVTDITRANKKKLDKVRTLLVQSGVYVLGCVVNRQHRSHSDTIYHSYRSTPDTRKDRDNHSIKSLNGAPSSIATDASLSAEVTSQQDPLDNTIKLPRKPLLSAAPISPVSSENSSEPDHFKERGNE